MQLRRCTYIHQTRRTMGVTPFKSYIRFVRSRRPCFPGLTTCHLLLLAASMRSMPAACLRSAVKRNFIIGGYCGLQSPVSVSGVALQQVRQVRYAHLFRNYKCCRRNLIIARVICFHSTSESGFVWCGNRYCENYLRCYLCVFKN